MERVIFIGTKLGTVSFKNKEKNKRTNSSYFLRNTNKNLITVP